MSAGLAIHCFLASTFYVHVQLHCHDPGSASLVLQSRSKFHFAAMFMARSRAAAFASPQHHIARLLILSCTDQLPLRLAGLLRSDHVAAAVLALPRLPPSTCLPRTKTPSRKSATTLSIHAKANGQAPARGTAGNWSDEEPDTQ